MASTGGSHGIARTTRKRTEEQRQQDAEKIRRYRSLEDQLRDQTGRDANYADPTLLDLTTRLLRLNPEYYTAWNVRRRCLTSGSFSRPSAGSWPSRASPSTSASATTRPPSDDSSPSSSAAIPPAPGSPTPTRGGPSGTTADGDADPEQRARDVVAHDTSVIQSELQFTIPLLLEFPKCYWLWNHRAYMLSLAISRLPAPAARQIWTAELGLVSKMLTKDRRNFHAWGYRRQVVARLEAPELEGTSMVEPEFEYTTKKIRDDLSNFSAWHGRSQLVLRLLDERGADDAARRRLLEEELDLVREGLNVGPEDQSLWYYHQFLMSHLLDSDRPSMAPNLTPEERAGYVEKEIEEIKDLLEDYEDVKWIYEALLEYTTGLARLRRRSGIPPEDAEAGTEVRSWLASLEKLDPMRKGRWADLEKTL